jgi:LPS-assembly protein
VAARASCLALVLALVSAGAAAQEPSPSPPPSPAPAEASPSPAPEASPSPAPEASPSPAPAAPEASPAPAAAAAEAPKAKEKAAEQPDEGEVRIRADTFGGEKGIFHYRGFVDLKSGDVRIQADTLDFQQTQKPDGATEQHIVAEGNVVFMRGEERLAGRRMEMNLTKGSGFFEEARGYVSPGVFVEARRIERVDADTYRIEGGKFTSCAQPTPRWSFSASSARLEVEDKIVANNVVFRVKQVPAFYVPYFMYPIQSDQRSTGFLFPHFGYSQLRGFNVGLGFFWAMGRSFDQTFYADNYSKFGHGFGHEFRYALGPPSKGNFKTYAFRPKAGGPLDYDLDWNAQQMLPGKFRGTLHVRQYSDLAFQEQIQDSLNLASSRTRRTSFSVTRGFGTIGFQALADSTETFFTDGSAVNEHLPTVRLNQSPRKIGRSGVVVTWEARGEGLGLGDQDRVDRYGRYDVYPRVSRPFSLSFLQLNPELNLRYTRYGSSLADEGIDGPSLDRRYAEASLEMRGPTFSRVFNTPGNFYSEKYKHVIGPEVTWTYRSRVDDFDLIPKFDGIDYFLGTNEVRYSLIQRLLAKRPTAGSDKLETWEIFAWRVSQTYYVQIAEGQNEFDPNYSSSAFGPGGVPAHLSPLQSRFRFRPTPSYAANFDLEYDVNFNQLRSLSLSGTVNRPRVTVQAGWSRAVRLAEEAADRITTRNTVRANGRFYVLPGKLALEGSADYDLVDKNLVQATGRVRYDVQCCGFIGEVIQSDYNTKQDRQFRFSIELANLGAMTNMMGIDAEQATQGFAGGRR